MLAWVLAVVVCLSVCTSVTRRYCFEMAVWIELIFAYRFPSAYATLYFKKLWYVSKYVLFPLFKG